MAREDEEGGSLDMLLDTLCNTFGGIILIALLLALSVNKKSVELYDKLVKTDDNESELIREREQQQRSQALVILMLVCLSLRDGIGSHLMPLIMI